MSTTAMAASLKRTLLSHPRRQLRLKAALLASSFNGALQSCRGQRCPGRPLRMGAGVPWLTCVECRHSMVCPNGPTHLLSLPQLQCIEVLSLRSCLCILAAASALPSAGAGQRSCYGGLQPCRGGLQKPQEMQKKRKAGVQELVYRSAARLCDLSKCRLLHDSDAAGPNASRKCPHD